MATRKKKNISGTVRSIDRSRGFGFLHSEDFERDVFFSLSDLPSKRDEIGIGSALRGEVVHGPKGPRLVGISVMSTRQGSPHTLFAILAFLASAAIATATWLNFEIGLIPAWLVGVNVGAVFFMGLDKSLARSSSVRTPEAIMYVLALLGGSPGVLLGIHMFRHKTRKAAFQFVLLLIFGAQAALLRALDVSFR